VFDRSGKANIGHALETCVLLELERRGAETAYVRTADGQEVDFLARYPGGKQDLIQVCADIEDPATRSREANALLAAAREHPRASLNLVVLQAEGRYDLPAGVALHWAPEWFLSHHRNNRGAI
jgi:predicted AAA+ superfamily ATPase